MDTDRETVEGTKQERGRVLGKSIARRNFGVVSSLSLERDRGRQLAAACPSVRLSSAGPVAIRFLERKFPRQGSWLGRECCCLARSTALPAQEVVHALDPSQDNLIVQKVSAKYGNIERILAERTRTTPTLHYFGNSSILLKQELYLKFASNSA